MANTPSDFLHYRSCTSDLYGVVDNIPSGDILRDRETGTIHSTEIGATEEAL